MSLNKKHLLFSSIAIVAISGAFFLLKKPNPTPDTRLDVGSQPSVNQELSFKSIYKSDGSSISIATLEQKFPQGEGALLIKDLLQMEQIWSQLNSNNELLPFDATEFEVSNVILVMSTLRGSGGYALAATEVMQTTPDLLTISVNETIPGEGCAVTTVITRPFELILIPNTTANTVVIDKTIIQKSCE